ncbi:sigma-54-dependent transcriptional regulator [Roseospirillum parvum]|uniref:Two-component system, NtrC family, nitrogen regulation response regulator NtrX n=1 Tax=Roseospirillum parvum TaxID=83401 RepID=A0A1G7YB09_9PROT|nr:sigma-54 dependent transcriptional regulator [Roseospirillum parvum]SDG93190.1 two-component system, NtrC family, nitrogen regulation response regulator NtrX [Roseospirillum parvum]
MAKEILIVDDEADIRAILAGILEDEGYTVRQAADSEAARAAILERPPSLVVLDIWLVGSRLDGLQLLDLIVRDHPQVPVVMISGHGNIETAVSAIKRGAFDFIEKPFQTDRLLLIVERGIEIARLRRELADLRQRTVAGDEFIGASGHHGQLRQMVEKLGPASSRVFINGPQGAGKEVVARQIHAASPRAAGPFVVVTCAALAPESMELELFGTENPPADSPNGARRIGLFEQAHGGTLLLDEVADMPEETQGKIVRVLQEQRFCRVGGSTRVEVDVRVMATTSRDMEAAIATGRFRQDLFYRLNVVSLEVPALRQRREDITALAEYFMARAARLNGVSPRPLAADALAALQAYDWPGNVRQLRNVIDWVLIMGGGTPGSPVKAEMLPPEITSDAPQTLRLEGASELLGLPLREAREMFEREYLLAQVTRFGGNISRTAEFVGMERSALHRKLKSLGVVAEGRA